MNQLDFLSEAFQENVLHTNTAMQNLAELDGLDVLTFVSRGSQYWDRGVAQESRESLLRGPSLMSGLKSSP